MEDIVERFKARDEEDQRRVAANKVKADADAAVAADMRKATMETFSQTKKRKGEQDVKKSKRATGSDTVAFLREKAELDAALKREELKIRKQEMKDKKAERDNLHAQQQSMSAMPCMQQQQRKQAQLMQQIQLQNAAVM
ncbi:caldesmon-like [Montipora foliosa]|uniref:caldesmon-like n=1 Tax=Montipora foliosa TaxID=591990 RepID=UPI0035F2122D